MSNEIEPIPSDEEVTRVPLSNCCGVLVHLDLILVAVGLSASRAEAQRKIKEGAVYVDGDREEERLCVITLASQRAGTMIRVGKRAKKVVWN